MIELQTVTTKAKNPSTNEFQDVTWGGINVLSTSGTTNYNNLTNKPTINGVTVQGSLTTGDLLITAADVGALPSGTKYGADFALSIDSQTFVVTAQLKDQDGNNLGQAKSIDLPLETMVVSGSYDDTTQKIILTLKNGQTVEFSVADLVSGLQSEITLNNKLDADLVSDVSSENKFVTTAEKTAWNGKQDAISDLSTIRSGAAAGATALQQSDVTSTYSASGTAPVNGTAVSDALGTLNKSSVGGSGKYISEISESNGKINATPTNFDTSLSSSSTNSNAPTTKAVYDDQQRQEVEIGAVKNNISTLNKYGGGKNKFNIDTAAIYESNASYTKNSDGTINVTKSTNTIGQVSMLQAFLGETGTYIISGCPSGGSSTTYEMLIQSGNTVLARDYGEGASVSLSKGTEYQFKVVVRESQTLSNKLFKPMISVEGGDYQPYARTNAELTTENASQQSEIDYVVNTGAKNLLLNKHSVGNVTETDGFRFTPQSDGGIKIESIGTHSENGDYYIQGDWGNTVTVLDLSDDTYAATISCETTVSERGIRLRIYGANNTRIINDLPLNDETNFTGEVKFIFITVISTTVIPSDGIVVYPMIRHASIKDPTFEPYALPNPTLTPAVIKAVDEGAKNLSSVSSGIISNSGGGFPIPSTPITVPVGTYIVSFKFSGNATRGSVQFRSGSTTIDSLAFDMASLVSVQIEITSDTIDNFNLYSNSTATISEFMICTAADWAVSQKFVPYAPTNRELWQKINAIKRTYKVPISSTPVNGIYFGVQMFPFEFDSVPEGTVEVQNIGQGGVTIDPTKFTVQKNTWGFRIYTTDSTYAGLIPDVKIS